MSNFTSSKPRVQVGEKYGSMSVIEFIGRRKSQKYFLCRCACGNEKPARECHLRSGNIVSCGCSEFNPKRKHGLALKGRVHPLYNVLSLMKSRCYNPKNPGYNNYGGRGISICDEWRNDFKTFYDWALQNGWREGLEIDRENNDGNYEPSNCRFVTCLINARNRRSTRLTEEQAIQIRNSYATGKFTHKSLARVYGIWPSSVGRIINNKIWS